MGELVSRAREVAIEIGAMPIVVRTDSPEFARLLEDRYGKFVTSDGPHAVFQLEVELVKEPGFGKDDEDLSVRLDSRRWVMERGDFRAEWDPELRQGWVRQTANPYSIDAVLRILHSLILAREGGFLVHAASAIRNGRAFLFAGASGAGKTTLARLAPPDVAVLTDEISYVREVRIQDSGFRSQESEVRRPAVNPKSQIANHKPKVEDRKSKIENRKSSIVNRQSYEAFGTPFAGEMARIGENLRAPVAALYLLAQGPQNSIEPVGEADAARALLQNILFFAQDSELVRLVFQSAVDFVSRVPVRRLLFTPDARVWELIT
jgi:energy-coupling factor transporter ATP-binding protein EcfA2